jgi:hypothetical protein
MVRISVLGDALKTMYNAEKRGKRQVGWLSGQPACGPAPRGHGCPGGAGSAGRPLGRPGTARSCRPPSPAW